MFARLRRTFTGEQFTHLVTLFLACFWQLDVVQNAHLLDNLAESPEKAEVERQTQVFHESVLIVIANVIAASSLGIVVGFVRVLLRKNIVLVAMTRVRAALVRRPYPCY